MPKCQFKITITGKLILDLDDPEDRKTLSLLRSDDPDVWMEVASFELSENSEDLDHIVEEVS